MSDALPQSTSDLLLHLAAEGESETLTLGALLDALSDRAFGIVMLVLALPCCIPFVYVIPQIVAVPMFLIAIQIVIGRHTLWLPQRLRTREIARADFQAFVARTQKYLRWFEALSRPRLTFLTQNGLERAFGLLMAVFCISILLPLPSTNTVPGIAIAIMSLGFLERDGALVILGSILGSLWVAMLIFFASVFVGWIAWLQGLMA